MLFLLSLVYSLWSIPNAHAQSALDIQKDLSVKGDLTVNNNLLYVDSSSDEVGILTSSPNAMFDVNGNVSIDGALSVLNSIHIDGTSGGEITFGNGETLDNTTDGIITATASLSVNKSVTASSMFFSGGANILSDEFLYYDTTGGQAIVVGIPIVLNLDTEVIMGDSYSISADVITFEKGGTYSIKCIVGTDQTNTAGSRRATAFIQMQEDTGGGMGDVANAIGHVYHRESTDNSGEMHIIRTYEAGNRIQFHVTQQNGEGTNMETEDDVSRVYIRRLWD